MSRLWLLGLLAVLFVGVNANQETFKPTAEFIEKQKNILELLHHVGQPEIINPHLHLKALKWDINQHRDGFRDETVVDRHLYLKNFTNTNLARKEVFSIHHPQHLKGFKSLYDLFITAKDYATFYDVATWARNFENEVAFVVALYTAVLHRPDTKFIKLPPLYEVYPYLYYNANVVKAAIDYKATHAISDNVGNTQPLVIEAKYSGWNVDHETNLLNKVNYFSEDIGLNLYYTYLNLNNPFFLSKPESKIRGEEYLYTHKHLLNRYNLEKLSNGLPFVEDFLWIEPFPIPFEPNLMYHSGVPVPHRQSNAPYPKNAYYRIKDILNYESRISAAIDSGSVLNSERKWVNIYQPGGLNILGNLIQGNEDSVNKKFYGSIDAIAKKTLGFSSNAVSEHSVVPSVLETLTVPLRDPAFFSITKKIVGFYDRYKVNQAPYNVDDVIYKSLKIKSVNVDELVTYFDTFESTINNGLLVQNARDDDVLINAKQWRLNHKPFNYNIEIESAKQQKASIKIFLGPKYDVNNKLIQLPEGYTHFYELDSWLVTLNAGDNSITRSSDEALFTIPDYLSTRKYLASLNSHPQLLKKIAGFPQRLLLPKGSTTGQVYQLFVYVSPLKEEVQYQSNVFGSVQLDSTPLGFPLDKPINELRESRDNFQLLDVVIKHKIGPADDEISF